jgi:quercetin dioxygenase-like cupin family protein
MNHMPIILSRSMDEIVHQTAAYDARHWVQEPEFPNVTWLPLMFDLANGNHVEIMKVKRGGHLGRHLHATPVHGFVLQGSWRYVEKNWVAQPGGYMYEPAGDKHTLVCDDPDGMATFFHIFGPIIYLNDDDSVAFIDDGDNAALVARAKARYEKTGLGAHLIDALCR